MMSESLKGMIEALGDRQEPIPLPYSIETIKTLFSILKRSLEPNGEKLIEEELNNISLDQLRNVWKVYKQYIFSNKTVEAAFDNSYAILFSKEIDPIFKETESMLEQVHKCVYALNGRGYCIKRAMEDTQKCIKNLDYLDLKIKTAYQPALKTKIINQFSFYGEQGLLQAVSKMREKTEYYLEKLKKDEAESNKWFWQRIFSR